MSFSFFSRQTQKQPEDSYLAHQEFTVTLIEPDPLHGSSVTTSFLQNLKLIVTCILLSAPFEEIVVLVIDN